MRMRLRRAAIAAKANKMMQRHYDQKQRVIIKEPWSDVQRQYIFVGAILISSPPPPPSMMGGVAFGLMFSYWQQKTSLAVHRTVCDTA